MPSDKDRLYIAFYHWAFIIGPKKESASSEGRQFHAKETMTLEGIPPVPRSRWQYESKKVTMAPISMLLIRIVIAKVEDKHRLVSIFDETPLRPEVSGWNCVAWVEEGFDRVLQDGRTIGTSADSWKSVRDTAMWYVTKKKAEHRFDGTGTYDPTKAPTWDMLESRELLP
ncbi:hypothetical protein C8034_v003665 [Colletotrichum sidae]|uniref:Uncharacterized protein n=1 Tax=Colletotrichum sidae TaxID=1347389 RepID=A0A4R8T9Z7_9PEZI|nr:hypothetical protein C8034_v003665 [Colletotrichum sidae]